MNHFVEFSILISVAAGVAIIMRLIKQPLIIGHIITGLIVGPLILNLIGSPETLTLFSEIGIAILLFLVGLHLHPKNIQEFGGVSVITGVGQVAFTSLVGFFVCLALGIGTLPAIYVGVALAFSSTIIVMKLIGDKGDIDTLYGRITIGFLLVQDLIAILILFLLPLIATGDFSASTILLMFIKGTALLAIMYIVSKKIVPWLGNFMARSQELLFLFTVAWGLGISAIFYVSGFSLESGALIAGISLATLPTRNEVSARLTPLRDFFIIMFFVLLGSQMDFGNIMDILPAALALSVLILIGNPLILMSIMGLLGYKKKTSLQTGFTVAQISEFSLIVIALGFKIGHLDQQIVSLVTLVGLITIFGSTYFILYSDKIYLFLEKFLSIFERKKILEKEREVKEHEIMLFGGNRVGYSFLEKFKEKGRPYIVIDHDPEIINHLHEENVDALYGDASDITFLEALNFSKIQVIVSTIPSVDINSMIGIVAREHCPDAVFVATAQRIAEAQRLYEEGFDYVMMPHFLGSLHAAEIVHEHHSDKAKYLQLRNEHLKELNERFDIGHEHP